MSIHTPEMQEFRQLAAIARGKGLVGGPDPFAILYLLRKRGLVKCGKLSEMYKLTWKGRLLWWLWR